MDGNGNGEGPPPFRTAARTVDAQKVYGEGSASVAALRGVTMAFPEGRFSAIMGPSGSGKSTLLYCLAGLDRLTAGRVWLGDTDLTGLSEHELTMLRRTKVGFIFQAFNLVPTLTAQENITLPLDIAGAEVDRSWLNRVIDTLGIGDRLTHRPSELSGGQQQRVAAARALAARPAIVFADEPTGNLDSRSGAELLQFMRHAVEQFGQTIVMVTHDPIAASYADRVYFLADGMVADELSGPTPEGVLDRMKALGG